jgi:hypothetical protein
MPWRLASDWNHRWAKLGCTAPSQLRLLRLRATDLSVGLEDSGYLKRVRAQFREWQRERDLHGGFYGVTVAREGDCWRAELLVAIGDDDRAALVAGRKFSLEVLGHALRSEDILRAWQQAYLNEAVAWQDPGELAALRALIKGRRKFQGFGVEFASKPEAKEDEMDRESKPLHLIAGGSGKGDKQKPCCPRCGERLRRVGLFDHSRMEMFIGDDGVAEWRWRSRPGQ